MTETLKRAIFQLEHPDKNRQHQVVVGFDGFIDSLVYPVKTMQDEEHMEFFESIEGFGDFFRGKANKSCSIELYPVMKKMGGNAPIFGKAIASLGIVTKCIGAFGYPEIDEIFQGQEENLEMISIANPGICTALEFLDGKVMLAENQGIRELNYEILKKRVSMERIFEILEQSDVISLMNWSEVLGSESIWEGILTDMLPKIPHTVWHLYRIGTEFTA